MFMVNADRYGTSPYRNACASDPDPAASTVNPVREPRLGIWLIGDALQEIAKIARRSVCVDRKIDLEFLPLRHKGAGLEPRHFGRNVHHVAAEHIKRVFVTDTQRCCDGIQRTRCIRGNSGTITVPHDGGIVERLCRLTAP